jgi:hypothetical protein
MLELILIHKGGLPILLELALTVLMMPLIIIMMVLLLNLGWPLHDARKPFLEKTLRDYFDVD